MMKSAVKRLLTESQIRWISRSLGVLRGAARKAGAYIPSPLPYGAKILTDQSAQIFFGYYDISPFSSDNRLLLAMRARVENKSPHETGAPLETGYFDMNEEKPAFRGFGKTFAWNWQQGCRLRWYPDAASGKALFNSAQRDGPIIARLVDITSGEILKDYPSPVYDVSPDGAYGVGLDFKLLHECRQGYGYSQGRYEDGIVLTDMQSGDSRLILSLEEISAHAKPNEAHGTHYINHLSFNPCSTRFLFFHLWTGENGRRGARLMTANRDGTELRCLCPELRPSHYDWIDHERILLTGTHNDGRVIYAICHDRTGEIEILGPGKLNEDGHPSWHGSGKILSDTYPDALGFQRLFTFDPQTGEKRRIGAFYLQPDFSGELRCDLHPRFSPDGAMVCVDIVREGRRALCVLPFH